MDTPNAAYDSVWKQAIERYWPDFTELFLLEEWGGRPAPESRDQELAKCSRDGKLGLRRVDKLLRAVGQDGRPCLWHIEVQVARQRDFAERMLICHYRLFDHFRLPVRSIAILGDPSPSWHPTRCDLAAGRTRLSLAFETVKLREFDGRMAELLLSDNIFAWLVVAHLLTLQTRREPETRMFVKSSLLTGLRTCGWEQQKFRDAFDLVDWMMTLPIALQDALDEQQELLEGSRKMAWRYLFEVRAEERGRQRGLEVGREQGREQGRVVAARQMLVAQLARRFGPLDQEVRQRIESATIDELETWCLAVVTARTIDEVF